MKPAYALVLSLGPVIYLVGSAIYKWIVFGSVPVSHIVGTVLLCALIPALLMTDLLTAGWLTSAVMLVIGIWEGRIRRNTGSQIATH